MPNAAETEAQFARLLGGQAQTAVLMPLRLDCPRGRSADYLFRTAQPWWYGLNDGLDGLIVTGAPVETLPFEDVTYWGELCALMDAVRSCAAQSLYICWSAQAALWHRYRIPKHALPEKAFGVFRQQVLEPSPLLDGLGTHFPVPVSRHTEVHESDLPPNLHVLARSARSGLCLIADEDRRTTYMFNHLEYEVGTLVREYERDRMAGKATNRPGCDHRLETPGTWLPSARRFFGNWLTSAAAVREERCPLADPLAG